MGNVADDGSTALYRLYDRTGELLYVGIAFNPVKRVFSEHEDKKHWFGDVATVKINWFLTRDRAVANEAYLIDLLEPQYNIMHNVAKNRRCEYFPSCTEPVKPGRAKCQRHRYVEARETL